MVLEQIMVKLGLANYNKNENFILLSRVYIVDFICNRFIYLIVLVFRRRTPLYMIILILFTNTCQNRCRFFSFCFLFHWEHFWYITKINYTFHVHIWKKKKLKLGWDSNPRPWALPKVNIFRESFIALWIQILFM